MWDMVVHSIVKQFGERGGVTTLRFNFRSGVGSGEASMNDVRGACDFLLRKRHRPPESILLVGYSYGSLVVAGVAESIPEVVAMACVCPPLYFGWALFMCRQGKIYEAARRSRVAKLLLIGERDNFCSVEQFNDFAATVAEPKRVIILRGAVDHFNIVRFVDEPLRQWACAVFGAASMAQLATCSRPTDRLAAVEDQGPGHSGAPSQRHQEEPLLH